MPPGYQTRLGEIERLSADLDAMDRIGRVLWESGEPLRDAVARCSARSSARWTPRLAPPGRSW